jgi:NADH dehydrogenase
LKVLVTGGTGFVGWNIVEAGVEAGHEVVSLSRGVATRRHAYPVTSVSIDLVRPTGLVQALAGVDVVVHAAGVMCEDDGQSFERAHVGATANLVEACREAEVGKIIHISALGARTDSPVAYLKTKWQAEDVIESSGIPFTILQPSLIFGERDRLTSHLVALLRFSPLVPVLGHDDAKVQPVWVGDVCMAVLRALNDASSDGRTFQLGGPASMSFAQIVETVQKITGARAISVPIPSFIAGAFVKLGEQIFDDPPFTGQQLGLLAAGGTCDPHPAAVAFGLRMRSLGDALLDYLPRDK